MFKKVIRRNYPPCHLIETFLENFKDRNIIEKISGVLSDVFESLTLGGAPLALLGKKAEKEEKQKEVMLKKETFKNEIKEILKNYSEPSEEKTFLEFLLEKI